MRWFRVNVQGSDKAVHRWFAVFPVTVGEETRWLEWVVVEYRKVMVSGANGVSVQHHPVRFLS